MEALVLLFLVVCAVLQEIMIDPVLASVSHLLNVPLLIPLLMSVLSSEGNDIDA